LPFSAGPAFGHFVAQKTAGDYPNLVRAIILIGAAQKTSQARFLCSRQRSLSAAMQL
jgi:pimeloyl-ACP methyl ester carboxylesterase